MSNFNKTLAKLQIVQTVSNPLSYIAIIIILFVGILMFGFVGCRKSTTTLNPFRWDWYLA